MLCSVIYILFWFRPCGGTGGGVGGWGPGGGGGAGGPQPPSPPPQQAYLMPPPPATPHCPTPYAPLCFINAPPTLQPSGAYPPSPPTPVRPAGFAKAKRGAGFRVPGFQGFGFWVRGSYRFEGLLGVLGFYRVGFRVGLCLLLADVIRAEEDLILETLSAGQMASPVVVHILPPFQRAT